MIYTFDRGINEQSTRGDARPQKPENEKSGRSAGRDLRRGNNGTSTNTINEHDPERYSARQDVKMKMGGFVGEVEYRGQFSEFVPLLKL